MASMRTFILDLSLSLCIYPGMCSVDATVFNNTKLVVPGCGLNQTFNIHGNCFTSFQWLHKSLVQTIFEKYLIWCS